MPINILQSNFNVQLVLLAPNCKIVAVSISKSLMEDNLNVVYADSKGVD